MSFTYSCSAITSSYSATTRPGVIFLAKVVIISSLLAELSVASSIGGSSGTSAGGGVGGESKLANSNSEVWFRNLDTQLLRLGSRLDQLMIRMDHLDSRVGRIQSQGHLRFDSIETSMQTTRQRLDLWSNQLNLIEEQLSRKWKNMESRFDSLVTSISISIDSKLDTKFNLIQRDNRRHNEFISSSFNSVIISQEKLNERVVNSLSEMNSSVTTTKNIVSNSTDSLITRVNQVCSSQLQDNSTLTNILNTFLSNFTVRSCPHNPVQHQQQNNNHRPHHYHHNRNNNLVGSEQLLPPSSSSNSHQYFQVSSYNSQQQPNSTSQVQLITSKVTNMFDELVKRSQNLEAIVKDTFTMSNATRREVQDGFSLLIPVVNQISIAENNGGARSVSNGGASSAEVMSILVDAISSVESKSTILGRRMTELNRSIEDKFGLVSMTLNGLLESCLRIQERAPLIEDRIANILDMILDTVDNSTRNATETWQKVQIQLLKEQQQLHHHYQRQSHHHQQQSKRNISSCSDNLIMASLQRSLVNQQRYAASQGQNVNQATTTTGEYPTTRNRSSSVHPVSSTTWGLLQRGGEEDDTGLETGGSDHENIVVGTGLGVGGGGDENEEHKEHNNNEDNDDHVDGEDDRHPDSGGEDESEEPLKIGRSKLLFNTGQHHHHRHHQHYSSRTGGGGGVGGGNVNRNGSPSTDWYPIPYPSTGIASISGTNIRSPPQTSMSFSRHHNGNDNVNLAQQGLGPSSSSSALLGVRRTTTSDNNNGMGVVSSSSSSAHVNSNSNSHNHNGGNFHGGGVHLDVEELSEEDKKRFWESWLSPHTRGSVPE